MSQPESPNPEAPVSLETASDLDELIATHPVVLVEFYTDGCGVCHSMEPILGLVAREVDAVVATINPRDDPPLIDRFDVTSIPLHVLFIDGEPVKRRADGFVGADELTEWMTVESEAESE